MIVQRTVVLNRYEPAPLSFRAPLGLDTTLDLTYYNNSGLPYASDLASQLQLTGRSTGISKTYMLPATDIVNGRARAFIPADDLVDPNGWRLRLVGTLNGEPTILAIGSVAPTVTDAMQALPIDAIDSIDLTFDYNMPVELDVSVWKDATKNSEYDLTASGTSISASVYDAKGGITLMPFTITVLDPNTVRLTLTDVQVNMLPPTCWWSMIVSTSAGATTIAEGNVLVRGTIVPALVTTTVNYDYQKPASGDINPVNGQLIHNSISQNTLKVAKMTQLGVDMTATLALVRAGDTIALGTTTWTVSRSFESSGWFEFTVTPIAQDGVTGVTTVTFTRPLV